MPSSPNPIYCYSKVKFCSVIFNAISVGFLSAVAAVGAGQWEQLQPLEIMRECFQGKFKGKFDPEQKLREDAAEYQNHIESYIAENDR